MSSVLFSSLSSFAKRVQIIKMPDSNNDSNNRIDIKVLGEQVTEAHKGLREIIKLWFDIIKGERDPSIRFLVIMFTFAGSILLFAIAVICIHCIFHFATRKSGSPPFMVYFIVTISSAFGVLLVALISAPRFSSKASTHMLGSGYERIYDQRYGSQQGED